MPWNVARSKFHTNDIQNLSLTGWGGVWMTEHRSLLSHWSRWQSGGSIFSPSIHHNGEFVVKPQLGYNGLEGGAVEICQLEWAGRSRGCGQRHSDTLSSSRIKNIYKLWSGDGIKSNTIVLTSQQIKYYQREGGDNSGTILFGIIINPFSSCI